MTLNKILKSPITTGIVFGITTAFDSVSTYFGVQKFGVELEKNLPTRWFMENQGILTGLIEEDILGSLFLVGGAYCLYKMQQNRKTLPIIGKPINYINLALYGSSVAHFFCATSNTIGLMLK